jgi:hypothetical protein
MMATQWMALWMPRHYRAPMSCVMMVNMTWRYDVMRHAWTFVAMARSNTTNITLQLGDVWRCSSWRYKSLRRCSVATCGLRRYSIAIHDIVALWRYTSQYCNVVALQHCNSRYGDAIALQLAVLWCCGAIVCSMATLWHSNAMARGTATLWHYNSRYCNVVL